MHLLAKSIGQVFEIMNAAAFRSGDSELANHMAGGRGANARLAVMSLAAVRDAAGPKDWPRLETKINTAIETVCGKHLDSSDKIIRTGDETYLVLVQSMSYERAAQKIEACCDHLARLFFGDQIIGSLGFEAEITEVLSPGSTKDPRTKKVSGTRDRDETERASQAAEPEEDESPAHTSRWMKQGHALEDFGRFGFIPVWNVRRQVLGMYIAGVWPERDRNMRRELLDDFTGDDTDLRSTAYAVAALRAATAALTELEKGGGAAVVAVPLDYSTLRSIAGMAAFTEAARQVPKSLRKLICIRLHNILQDKSPTMLEDRLGPIRGFFPNIVLVLDGWQKSRLPVVEIKSVSQVTLRLPDTDAARTKALGTVNMFVHDVMATNTHANIHGVADAAEMKIAVESGASFISGEGVGPVLDGIAPAVRCPLAALPLPNTPRPGEGKSAAA